MIYIIRHGQTELNKARKLQGKSDYPLNDSGIKQAEAAALWFAKEGISFSKVYSSPYIRAVQTAEIVSGGASAGMLTDDRLKEMDYGPYEGVDLNSPPEEIAAFFADLINAPAPKGMERLEDVVSRLGGFLEEIKEVSREGSVLISTHAIAMKGALEYLTPSSKGGYWAKHIANCSVYMCPADKEGFGLPVEVFTP